MRAVWVSYGRGEEYEITIGGPVLRLAHVSDLHIGPLPVVPLAALASKRLLGYISWRARRQREHRPEVPEALCQDLHAQKPDHIEVHVLVSVNWANHGTDEHVITQWPVEFHLPGLPPTTMGSLPRARIASSFL